MKQDKYITDFLMCFFMVILGILRLLEDDIIGLSVFVSLASLFFFSSYSSWHKEEYGFQPKNLQENRTKIFKSLSTPRIETKIESNSNITTLIVPSLEFYKEQQNKQNKLK
jgi:hypothetical protein